jgi:nucleoside diphosphate kinase
MKSKLIQIPYTVAIVKPHMALQQKLVMPKALLTFFQVDELYEDLEKNHFEVFHEERKILTREEVLNLFYTHRNASYYPDIQEHMMTAESIVMLLVNKVDKIPDPEDPEGLEEIKLDVPVVRWKKLLGDKQPDVAKEDPNSLRGKYGKDVIMNALHGSDDPKEANKERDIFLF